MKKTTVKIAALNQKDTLSITAQQAIKGGKSGFIIDDDIHGIKAVKPGSFIIEEDVEGM
jgi:hypothetical protein